VMSLTGLVGSDFEGFVTCGMDCYSYLGGDDFSIVIVSMACLVHCVYKFASCCLDLELRKVGEQVFWSQTLSILRD
jgi:hypothetical protein